LIRSKVKDPSLLIKTISSISGSSATEFQDEDISLKSSDQQTKIINELELKVNQFRLKEKQLREELSIERDLRIKSEIKLKEMLVN
jgi:hypothetical protein